MGRGSVTNRRGRPSRITEGRRWGASRRVPRMPPEHRLVARPIRARAHPAWLDERHMNLGWQIRRSAHARVGDRGPVNRSLCIRGRRSIDTHVEPGVLVLPKAPDACADEGQDEQRTREQPRGARVSRWRHTHPFKGWAPAFGPPTLWRHIVAEEAASTDVSAVPPSRRGPETAGPWGSPSESPGQLSPMLARKRVASWSSGSSMRARRARRIAFCRSP